MATRSDDEGKSVSPRTEGSVPGGTHERGFSTEDLERVIRRATELQFEEAGGSRVRDLLDERELLRIGAEVGIDSRHLRRAMEELRAEGLRPDLPSDAGALARLIGPGYLRATRAVPGTSADVEARLEAHLAAGESLTRVRKRGGSSLWEPAGGPVENLRRAFRIGGRSFELARAGQVELSVASLEEGHSLVTLTADVRKIRSEEGVGWMLGAGAIGAAASIGVGFIVLSPLLALPGALVGGGVGRVIGRSQFRNRADRIRLAMEGILDRLESGEPLADRDRGGIRKLRPD